MGELYVRFWGVRGSIPVPGEQTIRYGGNTSCFELFTEDNDRLIFDFGTGVYPFGISLDLSKNHEADFLLSHPHWDHINGLPLLPLIFIPGNRINIYGPATHEMSLKEIITGQMRYTYFPVRIEELHSEFTYNEIRDGDAFSIRDFSIRAKKLNHPVDCLGYRVEYGGRTFVYLGDNEPYYNVYNDSDPDVETMIERLNQGLVDFVSGADLLIADSQYLPSEYGSKKGFGHSTTHHVINLAVKAGVKHVYFNHHDPGRTDDMIDRIIVNYRKVAAKKGLDLLIDATAEGAVAKV